MPKDNRTQSSYQQPPYHQPPYQPIIITTPPPAPPPYYPLPTKEEGVGGTLALLALFLGIGSAAVYFAWKNCYLTKILPPEWQPPECITPSEKCIEGELRGMVACEDGSIIYEEVCENGVWTPTGQSCPPYQEFHRYTMTPTHILGGSTTYFIILKDGLPYGNKWVEFKMIPNHYKFLTDQYGRVYTSVTTVPSTGKVELIEDKKHINFIITQAPNYTSDISPTIAPKNTDITISVTENYKPLKNFPIGIHKFITEGNNAGKTEKIGYAITDNEGQFTYNFADAVPHLLSISGLGDRIIVIY